MLCSNPRSVEQSVSSKTAAITRPPGRQLCLLMCSRKQDRQSTIYLRPFWRCIQHLSACCTRSAKRPCTRAVFDSLDAELMTKILTCHCTTKSSCTLSISPSQTSPLAKRQPMHILEELCLLAVHAISVFPASVRVCQATGQHHCPRQTATGCFDFCDSSDVAGTHSGPTLSLS